MINSEVSDASYVIQGGVTSYPIGFEYHFNEQNSPQLLVKIGDREATINVDFQLSTDNSEIILIPTEEEAKNQTSPNDTRWMERINGKELYITRNIPFKQTSDYTVGRISPEQIEYDFDRTVMRDQEILRVVKEFGVDVALAESLSNAAVETANEAVTAANAAIDSANNAVAIATETVSVASEAKEVAEQASRDAVDAVAESANAVQIAEGAMAGVQDAVKEAQTAAAAAQQAADSVANKQEKLTAGTGIKIEDNVISTTDAYSKTEIDNKITVIDTAIDANTEAIQKTREDYIEADSEIHQVLNSHAGELSTLRGNQASLGNQVAGIEAKIPGTASGTNHLVTKQMLLDEEMDIREDLNESVGELQTQITAQAAEIAKKQDELTPGANITIVDGVISASGGATGDFLPLSGGTMTGPIRWDRFSAISGYAGAITISTSASSQYSFSDASFYSNASSNRQLGTTQYPWTKVFAAAISNGSESISVPAKSGTFALLEDLSSYVTIEEFDDAISGISINFVQRAELENGTAGQVLTKTDGGFEWQDASSGGTPAGTEYKDIQIGFVTDWATQQFYQVAIPESLNATLPVGLYSCEICVYTNTGDGIQVPYCGYKLYFRNLSLGEPADEWTMKYLVEAFPDLDNSTVNYFSNIVANTEFKYLADKGVALAAYDSYNTDTPTGLAYINAFGMFDNYAWMDWNTGTCFFRARVSKIKNETTGETFDYPTVSLFTAAEFESSLDGKFPYAGVVSSPAAVDINSIAQQVPTTDYTSMFAGDAYYNGNKKILKIPINATTCGDGEDVGLDIDDYSAINSGPWSVKISMTTEDKNSKMTFEYSNGYGHNRVEILHRSGIFSSVDKFEVEGKNYGPSNIYLSSSNGEAIFDQKIRVRSVIMGARIVNSHISWAIDTLDSIPSYAQTQLVEVIELGNISTALAAILGE